MLRCLIREPPDCTTQRRDPNVLLKGKRPPSTFGAQKRKHELGDQKLTQLASLQNAYTVFSGWRLAKQAEMVKGVCVLCGLPHGSEKEPPEEYGCDRIHHNLGESAAPDHSLEELNVKLNLQRLVLCYGHRGGEPELREHIADQYEVCVQTVHSS